MHRKQIGSLPTWLQAYYESLTLHPLLLQKLFVTLQKK